MVSPGCGLTAATDAHAVAPAPAIVAAASHDSPAGLAATASTLSATYSACAARGANPRTSSPTAKSWTPEPISATYPAKSLPCPSGKWAGQMAAKCPSRIPISPGLVAAVTTATTTCPGPAAGRGTSTTSRTSGPPYPVNFTALITIAPAARIGRRTARAGRPMPASVRNCLRADAHPGPVGPHTPVRSRHRR